MKEAQIIEGCIKKDRKAQDAFFTAYNGLLFGVCLRYTKNRFEAEDVLQEGLVKIYKNMHMYSEGKSFEGWIRRIMINTAITYYRKMLKHAYHDDVSEIGVASSESELLTDCEFTKEELLNTINELPNGYRTVFNLYVIEGYKHKEIAEQLGVDINTSKSQLSRAKKLLQTKLNELSRIKIPLEIE